MSSVVPILDGELLRAFVAFADALNFTRAAQVVGLSQPAMFERIARLADEVGATLYEREGRQLRLTDAGVRVAAFAREELARTHSFLAELRGEARRERIVLAAGEGAYLYLLGPAVRAFLRDEPDVALCPLTRGGPDAVEAVREGAAHLAVGVVDLVPEDLIARDLVRTPLCAAMSATHRLARRRSLRLTDLAGERLVLAPPGQSHRNFVGRALSGLPGNAAPPIEADGWPLMLQLAGLGLGVAIVNGICSLPRGAVARPVRELGQVTYRVMWRRGASLPPAASRLRDRILAAEVRAAT
ncbi:LysR family transcriptional regulator [Nannocystis sp. SCPEA4]|uniref:LysR family transcriptional regulator n=1 Tax=Nannocystis sp. SCPEA4 TaxID=2996787 RepID=UPI0022706145|nr:LysR family transcriptional regulator [Nannocystis sp. SCPEA4]MCY1057414.1 LysR family transcriptional regulator [Nannocystis sp. SCPEA4]